MRKRFIFCNLLILAIAMAGLPISRAQVSTEQASFIRISSYDDDPFVEESSIERIDRAKLVKGGDGHPMLWNDRVIIQDEPVIYRQNPATDEFEAFALNPFPAPASNASGNFKFPDEPRFPSHRVERGPDGKIILTENGLQVWLPQDLHLGMTTTFEAANAVKEAGESWSGRGLAWGNENGLLEINSHAFIDFNAFFSPTARALFFGVFPYRLPGETGTQSIKIFEMATSWEIAAHESGHALHAALKPNRDFSDDGYKTWSESFADQMAMWASLRDKDRARALLAEVNGNLLQSNSLTRIGEVLASLVGEGTGLRDSFHDKRVSDTSTEPHDRSEVLTGAAYRFFVTVYSGLKRAGAGDLAALKESGSIMGTFLAFSSDYMPENRMTLEDVARAYLKVDKEFYGDRYHDFLVSEFTRREILDENSVSEWMAHEAAVPQLRLPRPPSDQNVEELLQANLDRLGIGPDFGLKLQSVTRDGRHRRTIVHAQLTEGRGKESVPLDNHGILTFRADGTLADYHAPLPSDGSSQVKMDALMEALPLMNQAKQLRLDHRGAPLSIVRRPGGQLTVEARVMRSQGFYCWVEVFSLENPQGERREIITPSINRKVSGYQLGGAHILTADDLN